MAMRSEPGFGDDDRLPWLETVEEDYSEGGGVARILLLVLLLLLVAGAGAFAYFWLQKQHAFTGTGTGELINAPAGDYKVKPEDAGGSNAEGTGDTVYTTSQGQETNASVDTSKAPEEPVAGKVAPNPTQSVTGGSSKVVAAVPAAGGRLSLPPPTAPKPAPAKPAPSTTPATALAPGGAAIQLGSFPDEADANAAWTRLSKRFAYIAPLGHLVAKAEVNGKTVYRLRVTAGTADLAKDVCGKLKVAGESCYVPN